jgi:hypothetical protein
VLTIAGERLELSRLTRPGPGAEALFALAAALALAGALLGLVQPELAWRIGGAGFLGLTLWLVRHDVARRTIRVPGLPRFTAVCLLSGYVWLALAGGLGLVLPNPFALGAYDAMLHAVFLGFVFAMVFGHAPIILPAVTRWPVPFRGRFYLHFGLLEASLLLRLAGDALDWPAGRAWGGLVNAAAILLFLALTGFAVRAGRKSAARGTPGIHPKKGDA